MAIEYMGLYSNSQWNELYERIIKKVRDERAQVRDERLKVKVKMET